MYRAIARNKRNTVIIVLLFLVIIGVLGLIAAFYFNPNQPDWSIPIITIVVGIVYAAFQYYLGTRQTIALSGAHEIQKSDNPRLYRIVENLAITEGMPMPKVYVINDPAPNAFATGRDPKHAIVAATTGLLEIMDDSELEGVMAHEIGHVKNYDIRVSLIVFGLVLAIGLIADILLRIVFYSGRGRSSNNSGPAAIIMLVMGLAAAILAPLVAAVAQAAVSRQREYLADATGAMTTRHPEALARALLKLEAYGRPVTKTNTSMSHLWISDPNKPGFFARMFSTHPPIQDRVARLTTIGRGF
jgi:heat shock protein HtpX